MPGYHIQAVGPRGRASSHAFHYFQVEAMARAKPQRQAGASHLGETQLVMAGGKRGERAMEGPVGDNVGGGGKARITQYLLTSRIKS